jgi:hypothetical protein
MRQLGRRARFYSHLLPVIARHAVNAGERQRARALDAEQLRLLGPLRPMEKILRISAQALALRWDLRLRWFGDGIQPATITTRYRAPRENPSAKGAA